MIAARNSVVFAAAGLQQVRTTQKIWEQVSLHARLRVIRSLREQIARSQGAFLEAFAAQLRANPAERLASELIPLAEACRFLEEEAGAILASRTLTRSRTPLWMRGIRVEERRDPLGVVLIIGPANYPLFLPAVQAVQAIAAGNAVLLKPGEGAKPVLDAFREAAIQAGIPPDLIRVLGESAEEAQHAIAASVDKILLTGSVAAGRAVYAAAAHAMSPITLELSGCDPVFVQQGADLERAVDAISFGLRWNGGNTCIAPRRIFVAETVRETFEAVLQMRGSDAAQELPVTSFRTEEEALALAAESPFALGASVFGPQAQAEALARRVRAGVVVVNDMIAPTADPRVTFGGRGKSGFGRTRGAEGLRELTTPKVVIVQRAKRLRHLEPLSEDAENVFANYLTMAHAGSWRERIAAAGNLFRSRRKRAGQK
ncbi:MAG TPA: aldehyde dehydrogenase family protein [Bryobacteraceae bacterium]|jgi:acyl-CoA reductase-like NAD-dependent aldehyde dehydrogenase|nr:aldehyde dehydrogenase family protein [Bryobacteraceae bacterium]